MRRLRAAVILGVLFQILLPASASAWFEWLDPLSGPGWLKGWSLDGRLVCFTQPAAEGETSDDEAKRNFSGGFTFSACRIKKGEVRRASIDLGFRLLQYTDGEDSPECQNNTAGTSRFAGCNPMRLATFVPSFSWRLFADPKYDWLDWVDVSVGAGVYWFSSEGSKQGGFDSFSGVVVEPGRLDIHSPTHWTKDHWWAAIPNLRLGLIVFPAGFAPNAFGPLLVGPKANRIRAEWQHTLAIYGDLEPVMRHFSKPGK